MLTNPTNSAILNFAVAGIYAERNRVLEDKNRA